MTVTPGALEAEAKLESLQLQSMLQRHGVAHVVLQLLYEWWHMRSTSGMVQGRVVVDRQWPHSVSLGFSDTHTELAYLAAQFEASFRFTLATFATVCTIVIGIMIESARSSGKPKTDTFTKIVVVCSVVLSIIRIYLAHHPSQMRARILYSRAVVLTGLVGNVGFVGHQYMRHGPRGYGKVDVALTSQLVGLYMIGMIGIRLQQIQPRHRMWFHVISAVGHWTCPAWSVLSSTQTALLMCSSSFAGEIMGYTIELMLRRDYAFRASDRHASGDLGDYQIWSKAAVAVLTAHGQVIPPRGDHGHTGWARWRAPHRRRSRSHRRRSRSHRWRSRVRGSTCNQHLQQPGRVTMSRLAVGQGGATRGVRGRCRLQGRSAASGERGSPMPHAPLP